MNALTPGDILSIAQFKAVRPQQEQEVLAAKALRRVDLGPAMTLLFENRLTMRWQVHEMCRVENITRPEAVQHELDTYNALLPTPTELSATLLIAFAEPEERDRELRRLVGLQDHLHLQLADLPPVPARFDHEQYNAERVSSVQFVRFALGAEGRRALGRLDQPAAFVVAHPAYSARAVLAPTTRAALVEDLGA